MKASDLLFPVPRQMQAGNETYLLPKALAVAGEPLPEYLIHRLRQACEAAGIRCNATSGKSAKKSPTLTCTLQAVKVKGVTDEVLLAQAYGLELKKDGNIELTAPGSEGLRHGIITLCLLLEAAAQAVLLTALTIHDAPAFRVRGIHIDMAREFFPPTDYLEKIIDRLVDLKANTLWLYLENRLHVPGVDDISPRGGMTIEQAQAISAYGRERGIDVVPGTNVLSHMEGWFRLERNAHLSDGKMRSYPVLTQPEAWEIVQPMLDGLCEAFPSPNFHAGLDELLFTGTNPQAQAAIDQVGKPAYFADFACRVIDYLKSKGKTVWIWDDMVLGKNINRKEGFGDAYTKALERIDQDVIMTHWYYWTNFDGIHGPIMKRVAKAGRPFVVAPTSRSSAYTCPPLSWGIDNQHYMAQCGLKHGAFGLINTHWESRIGSCFEPAWPCLAMGTGYAWHGPLAPKKFLRAMGFVMTGDIDGSLGDLLEAFDALTQLLESKERLGAGQLRKTLILEGPQTLWRKLSPLMQEEDWETARELIAKARDAYDHLGERDNMLAGAMLQPISLFEIALEIVDSFNQAWDAWHEASELERDPAQRVTFRASLSNAVSHMGEITNQLRDLQQHYVIMEAIGHTSYDSHVLGRWIHEINRVADLMLDAAYDGGGLPYFEKLLYLPDAYHTSNLRQLQVQNTFHERYPGLPWLTRQAWREGD